MRPVGKTAFAEFIQPRLSYGVLRRVETQVLNGDGTGENIKGILQTTGIGTPASVSGDNDADVILNGIVAVLNADAMPNAAVCNPTDLGKMLKAKATSPGNRMDSGGAFGTMPQTIGADAHSSRTRGSPQALR